MNETHRPSADTDGPPEIGYSSQARRREIAGGFVDIAGPVAPERPRVPKVSSPTGVAFTGL